ncbi:hypothetical protein ACL00Q_11965 [Curtobacterium flaccumfaciens pv. flaccumfaciens]|uniref:hypothetical protein n=1 Tax=Curtobacterium flaccumfaciens TaxID=2035 RepID=UPI0039A3280E
MGTGTGELATWPPAAVATVVASLMALGGTTTATIWSFMRPTTSAKPRSVGWSLE